MRPAWETSTPPMKSGLLGHFVAVEDAARLVAEILPHGPRLGLQGVEGALGVGAAQIAGHGEVGVVDPVAPHRLLDGSDRLVAEFGHAPRHIETVAAGDGGNCEPKLRRHHPAVSPARPPTDAVRLDDQRPKAPLDETLGRRQSGITAADDHDVDAVLPARPAKGRARTRRFHPERGRPSSRGGPPRPVPAGCRGGHHSPAMSASIASASWARVAKWKSGFVTSFGTGVPPKPFCPCRRSIQHTE